MNFDNKFREERSSRIAAYGEDSELLKAARSFMLESIRAQYSYNFDCLSRPVIQYPQDIVAMQELIWRVKPDLILETGIAHGGSLILSASALTLVDYAEALENGTTLNPRTTRRRVLGVDIDIRPHNRAAIEAHPMSHRIDMIQGSSVASETISKVINIAKNYARIMVCLDSNHTHSHVLAELEAYAPLTSKDSYCCVFDTVIEDLPGEQYSDRPWGLGNNSKTAVSEFLASLTKEGRRAADGEPLQFAVDKELEQKLLITVAPSGYLRRI
jgi:cephalosporin hydroxylase